MPMSRQDQFRFTYGLDRLLTCNSSRLAVTFRAHSIRLKKSPKIRPKSLLRTQVQSEVTTQNDFRVTG